jgi:hypothetical protein
MDNITTRERRREEAENNRTGYGDEREDDFNRHIIEMDESLREIASLDELYKELNEQSQEKDLMKKHEAKYARERMLKLSLHVKHLAEKMASHEHLR